MPRPSRNSYATFAPEMMQVWERFAADGRVTLSGLAYREAMALKRALYQHRLRLLAARDAGDDLAAQFYATAQDAYITVSGPAPRPDRSHVLADCKEWSITIEQHPLKRALAQLEGKDQL